MSRLFPPAPMLPAGTERHESALAAMAVARGAHFDEINSPVYLAELQDLEINAFERACRQLAHEPVGEFKPALPTVGDIRARVMEIEREDAEAARLANLLPAPREHADDDPRTWVFCATCQDEPSGGQTVWCFGGGRLRDHGRLAPEAGMERQHCGRRSEHPPHTFAVKCRCYPNNPVAARKRDAMRPKQAPRRTGERD